jgi:chemotaxis protein MotB
MSHGEGGGGGGERWLISYADYITLLLAFFIILYSMAEADKEKFKQLGAAFAQTFGVLGLQGGGALMETSGAGGASEVFDFGSLPGQQRQFMGVSQELEEYVAENNLGSSIAVNVRDEGIAITLSNALLFPSGGVELSPGSRDTMAKIAELVRPISNEIRIEAHTDNYPTNSALYPTNWELSAARAAAVARYLIEQEDIDPHRLSILGHGEFKPIFPNDTRERRLMNRRADIVVLFPSDKVTPSLELLGTN